PDTKNAIPATEMVVSLQQRISSLEETIHQEDQHIVHLEETINHKDEHIAYLETLIKQIESGRLMKLLRALKL
ncbi:MAG: hypothetical protein ABIV47_24495, partial [Roseiflexaceae bacterium]